MARKADRSTTSGGHRPHPVTCSEFARRVGRGRSRVSEALRGALAPAVLPGGRIDAAHPAAVAWARERGADAAVLLGAKAVETEQPASPAPTPPPAARVAARAPSAAAKATVVSLPTPDDIDPADERLLGLTLGEIVDRYHSIQGFADHVNVVKTLHQIEGIELANRETRGELVSRAEVQRTFSALDGALRRMIVDVPKTIARRVKQDAAAGATTEEVEKEVRRLISSSLEGVKTMALERVDAEAPGSE